jgi:hypothetical protein
MFAIYGDEILLGGTKEAQNIFEICWHPGQENLADYQSKHHTEAHHRNAGPWYLHQENSPKILTRAVAPSTLKECVGTLKDGHIRDVPLPRVPQIQSASLATLGQDSQHTDTYYSQVP